MTGLGSCHFIMVVVYRSGDIVSYQIGVGEVVWWRNAWENLSFSYLAFLEIVNTVVPSSELIKISAYLGLLNEVC